MTQTVESYICKLISSIITIRTGYRTISIVITGTTKITKKKNRKLFEPFTRNFFIRRQKTENVRGKDIDREIRLQFVGHLKPLIKKNCDNNNNKNYVP